jgi:hypothetical protein
MIDPVSAALIAAAVAGATGGLTDVSKTALTDTYSALKAAIQKRFGQQHGLVKAVEALEAKPTSAGRQTTLVEEVTDAGVDQDTELVTLAEQICQLLKDQVKTNPAVQQIITGNYNATSVHGDANVTVQLPREV